MSTDVAADAFQAELDQILRGLVQTVNEEAAATVAEALAPTRESHAALQDAATTARGCMQDAGQLVTALQQSERTQSQVLSETGQLNTRFAETLDAFERRIAQHEETLLTRFNEVEQTVRSRATGVILAVVVCSAIVLGIVVEAIEGGLL